MSCLGLRDRISIEKHLQFLRNLKDQFAQRDPSLLATSEYETRNMVGCTQAVDM
jgi:hypothetical protein